MNGGTNAAMKTIAFGLHEIDQQPLNIESAAIRHRTTPRQGQAWRAVFPATPDRPRRRLDRQKAASDAASNAPKPTPTKVSCEQCGLQAENCHDGMTVSVAQTDAR